jgi:3-phenylpropionate/trans-cinnamate dioxygenase ferredoxin subunit
VNRKFLEAGKAEEIADGGMKAVEIGDREIVICNVGGTFHAMDRRCGHMSAPLEAGTLDGTIVTCPMHCAQFDVATGEALSPPVPRDFGGEQPGPRIGQFLGTVGMLMSRVKTCSVNTYETKVEHGKIWVSLDR